MATEDDDSSAEGIDKARRILADLTDDDLAAVLYDELDRRRLDDEGNPKALHGLYEAASIAVGALLGDEPAGVAGSKELAQARQRRRVIVERLAAVALGAKVNTKDQDAVTLLAELDVQVEATWRATNIPHDQRAPVFAKTLEQRLGRPISVAAVEMALSRPSRRGRLPDVAMAAGVLPGDVHNETDRRTARKPLDKALAQFRIPRSAGD